MEVVYSKTPPFQIAVDRRVYHLVDTSAKYNRMGSKYNFIMETSMNTQIKPHTINLSSPIFIIGFLKSFKIACDTNGVQEDAAICGYFTFS